MADEGERLVVAVEARIAEFEKRMRQAERTGTQSFTKMRNQSRLATRQMESDMARASTRINQALATTSTRVGAFGKAFAAGLIPAVTIQGVGKFIDASTKLNNALKVAGLSGADLAKVYDQLFASAQRNGAPIEALVTLYSRASTSAKELGASQEELLRFTDLIAVALRVSGQSATESAGALLQLSQALGNGVVQAEEYNSLLDGGRPILQAVAAGLKEAGGSVSSLTRLVKDGQVSSQAFFDAFLAGAPVLQNAVANSETTISQRMTRLQNVLIDAAGRFNESSKAAETFGAAIDGVSAAVASANFDHIISEVQRIAAAINAAEQVVTNFAKSIGELSGLSNVGEAIIGSLPGHETVKSYGNGLLTAYSTDAVQRRIDEAWAEAGPPVANLGLTPDWIRYSQRENGSSQTTTAKTSRLPAAPQVKPVSLSDYALPKSTSSGGGGRKGRGGGGGGSADAYTREVEQIRERTAAIEAETAAQAGLNPLMDDYGAASTRASAAADLLAAAQKSGTAAGKELSDVSQLLSGNFDGLSPAAREQAQAMLALADSYSVASAESQRLAESQQNVRNAAEDFANMGRDVTKGFIQDLRNGTSASEAFGNALSKIADILLDQVLNAIFSVKGAGGGGGGGGLLGSLFGGLFGGGGGLLGGLFSFDGGGHTGTGSRSGGIDGRGGFPAILHPNETVVDHTRQRSGSGRSASSSSSVDVQSSIVVRMEDDGRLTAIVEKTAAKAADKRVKSYDANLPGRVDAINRSPRKRVNRT